MRVSTFHAPTLQEAMVQVREALGEKAIILSWRNVRNGIEVSASVQNDPARKPVPPPAVAQKPVRGAGALLGSALRAEPSEEVPARQASSPRSGDRSVEVSPARHTPNAPIDPRPVPAVQSGAPKPQGPRSKAEPVAKRPPLAETLLKAGLSPREALSFCASDSPDIRRAMGQTITEKLRFEPIEAIPTHALALVGPAGCGKTCGIAKLAARTLAAGHDAILVSADSERSGGADQLKALADRLGARFEVVTTVADAKDLVTEARRLNIALFLDTAASSPLQPADMRLTARLVHEAGLEPIACLPADMRPDDLEDLARSLFKLGAKRAIATRMDLTNRRASVMYAAHQANLALAQLSASPYIAGGLAIASVNRLAALVLEPFDLAHTEEAA
jgi:flagellar biosynthesis protein FlhF